MQSWNQGMPGAFPFVIRINNMVPTPFINNTIAGLIPNKKGHQHRCAKHGKHMLNTKGESKVSAVLFLPPG